MGMLSTSIVGEVKTTATIVDTKVSDNPSFINQMSNGMGVVEDLQSIPEALNDSNDSIKESSALFKEFGNMMPEMIKNFRMMNDAVVRNTQNLPALRNQLTTEEQRQKRQSSLLDQSALSLVNNGSGIVQSYANGNFGGVASGFLNGATNIMNNGSKLAENSDMRNLAASLTKLGIVTAVTGAVVKGADTLATKYIDEMPTLFGTGRAFGDMSNSGAMIAYQSLNAKNRGTNLNITEFQTIAQSLRQQGVGNGLSRDAQLDLVGNIAARTGQLAYITGGDANQYASLAGLMSRYGGSTDVAGDFEKLIAAGRASGLNDTQIPEFLSSIQKVMEEGIAKGFTRSATDVASTMLMFSKMSGGNAFWQGEQGAKIINQANAGLSSATSLSKTTDILAYRAMNRAFGTDAEKKAQLGSDLFLEGGGYVNNMMLLEQGLNAKNFGAIMGVIGESTDSKEGQIERIRQMFGLNYTGASRLLQLDPKKFEGNEAAFEAELKRIQNDPEMQNNETRNQKALNEIKAAVVNVGEGLADMKIAGLDMIAGDVNKIATFIAGSAEDKKKDEQFSKMYNSLSQDQQRELNEIMPTFATREEKVAYAEWFISGKAGMPKGLNKNNVFSDYAKGDLKKKISWKEGSTWNDTQLLTDFTNYQYGDDILKIVGGDVSKKDAIIKELVSGEWGKGYRSKTVRDTDDKNVSKKEELETVNLIKEIVKILNKPLELNLTE